MTCEHPFALFLGGAEIPLVNTDEVMLVDAADVEVMFQHRWRLLKGKKTFYAAAGQHRDGTWVRAHRFLLDLTDPTIQVDHRNGNGLDNRRANLRFATPAENARNRRKFRNGRSSFIGVGPCSGRWRARIMENGKSHYLGLFDTEEEAALAYDYAARERFGEFASVNFRDL